MSSNVIGTSYIQIVPTTDGISGKITSALNGEMTSAGTSAGSKFATAFGATAKVAGAALAGATTAVTAFAKSSVDAGADFDSAMSQVGATMGFSTEEINTAGSKASETMSQLRDFAQEMGSTTAFSATESAEALNYMALAGYDANTSMQMLPTVLDLAAAGGMDLASASDMVTDAQTALGLSIDETSTMVDQMAKTSSVSNTSVSQLGEAFLTIGGNAKNLAGGTAELSQMLGVLADNGIKGSEAGTHLRNIMLAMNPTTDKAVAAWDELGVSAYDADGSLRPLQDTFADLSKAMSGMTDQEKTETISAMFNKTDLASVNALLDTTTERYTTLKTTIDDSANSASNMASVQLDNLAGDITLFESALEGAKIAVSDELTPTLRDFVEFGSDGLSRLTESFKTDGFSGAMEEFGNIVTEGLGMITEKLPEFTTAGLSLLQSLLDGISQNTDTIMESMTAVVSSLCQFIVENLPLVLEVAINIITTLAQGLGEALPTLIPAAVNTILNLVQYLLDNIDLVINAGLQIIIGLIEGLSEAMPQLMQKMPEIITAIVSAIVENLPQILMAGVELILALADGIVQAIPQLVLRIPILISSIIKGIIDGIEQFKKTGSDIVAGIWEGIKERWEKLVDDFKDLGNRFVETVQDIFDIGSPSKVFADKVGKWIPAGIAQGIDDNINVLDDTMTDVSNGLIASASLDVSDTTSQMYSQASTRTSSNDDIYGLLKTYLPMAMQRDVVNVQLQGDADRLFKMTQNKATQYTKLTGQSAFA